MAFWHELVTDRSFEILQKLHHELDFILIGGWAVYLYTHALKSKDIDIIIDYPQLDQLKQKYPIRKNDRLKKYEVKQEEIDIDIYVPYYSNPGIPAEHISSHCQIIENFTIPQPELLLLLKLNAYRARKDSVKGEKDQLDILSLLHRGGVDLPKFKKLAGEYNLSESQKILRNLLLKTRRAPEIGLNESACARLKRRILDEL